MKNSRLYLQLSERAVVLAGHRLVLLAAMLSTVMWCVGGVFLGLPTRWYLLTNVFGTMTTLFVLLIMQHSQNRDMHALQVKADELIRSSEARNHLIGVEQLQEADLLLLIGDRQADR
ncbi:low affinity iron permease family protein [Rhizobium sp. BK376]|uniref:low affinity iron permease family protein n=1 Tax=Rhizobium sp. BK376 TaxID=2512149 RepID=UPI00104ECE1A|nr:low affinity iron permease family protein [Rhizobium sp. BK376]TCR71045.1 low affinity iron permease [Rhizobium sp. BK376]